MKIATPPIISCLLRYGAVLLVGISVGWFLHRELMPSPETTILREPEGKYRFINPLIGFNPGEKKEFEEYAHLEEILENNIATLKQQGKIQSASVYFRNMENGRWTGVNEEELYSPASLYKVALMIAILKRAEDEPEILDAKVVYRGSRSTDVPDAPPMIRGASYSVRDLLERLITLSDNDAKDILRDKVGPEAVSSVFRDLQLTEPSINETGDTMSARAYSRFFRALYNATYLGRVSSEYALDLLSRVDFKSGIRNGLPSEVRTLPVAHKFGYRVFPDPIGSVKEELHDCGVVYLPEHPYFVCIMTKGSRQSDLMDAIQTLSRIVYTETIQR